MNLEINHFYFGLLLSGLFNFSSCKKEDGVNLQTCSDQITAAGVSIDDEADFNKYHYLELGDAIYSTEIYGAHNAGDRIDYILRVELKEICNADNPAISIRFNAKSDDYEGGISASLEELGSQTNFKILDLTQNKLEWKYSGTYAFGPNLGIFPDHLRINLRYYFKSDGSLDADNEVFYHDMLGMTVSIAAHKAE